MTGFGGSSSRDRVLVGLGILGILLVNYYAQYRTNFNRDVDDWKLLTASCERTKNDRARRALAFDAEADNWHEAIIARRNTADNPLIDPDERKSAGHAADAYQVNNTKIKAARDAEVKRANLDLLPDDLSSKVRVEYSCSTVYRRPNKPWWDLLPVDWKLETAAAGITAPTAEVTATGPAIRAARVEAR